MPNSISYDKSSGIYKVQASGIITIDDILESIADLEKLGVTNKLIYVLIDTLRQTSELSILDVEKVANAMPDKNRIKSAILTTSSHINFSEQTVLEKTANDMNKAIQVFTDRDDAINWLLGE